MIKQTFIPDGYYYSKAEAAQVKGVYKATIQQWIDKGWIKSIKIGGTHIIEEKELFRFTPPKPGRRKAKNEPI